MLLFFILFSLFQCTKQKVSFTLETIVCQAAKVKIKKHRWFQNSYFFFGKIEITSSANQLQLAMVVIVFTFNFLLQLFPFYQITQQLQLLFCRKCFSDEIPKYKKFLVSQVVIYSQQNIYNQPGNFTRAKAYKIKQFKKLCKPSKKIPATFLSLFLRKWNRPTNIGQLWWLLFLPLIFSLSLFCSHSPLDRWRKNEDSQHVSISMWKFPHILVACSLQKPIGSH